MFYDYFQNTETDYLVTFNISSDHRLGQPSIQIFEKIRKGGWADISQKPIKRKTISLLLLLFGKKYRRVVWQPVQEYKLREQIVAAQRLTFRSD